MGSLDNSPSKFICVLFVLRAIFTRSNILLFKTDRKLFYFSALRIITLIFYNVIIEKNGNKLVVLEFLAYVKVFLYHTSLPKSRIDIFGVSVFVIKNLFENFWP